MQKSNKKTATNNHDHNTIAKVAEIISLIEEAQKSQSKVSWLYLGVRIKFSFGRD